MALEAAAFRGIVDGQVRALMEGYVRAYRLVVAECTKAALAAQGTQGRASIMRLVQVQSALNMSEALLTDAANRYGVTTAAMTHLAVDASYADTAAWFEGAGRVFRDPDPLAIDAILTRSQQSITRNWAKITLEGQQAITDALISGVTTGGSVPRVTREVQQGIGSAFGNLGQNAVTIARTELLDASRNATRTLYQANSDTVVGWRWLSALGARTCAACWGMHNTVHKITESLNGHCNCRCTQVPILEGEDQAASDMGHPDDAFAKLKPETKLAILGPRRFEMWRDGDATLRDFAHEVPNPGWRPSVQIKPLSAVN